MNFLRKHTILSVLIAVILLTLLFILGETSVKTTLTEVTQYIPPAQTQTAAVSGAGSGLVAHYTFDEGSGTTAGDSAGSNTATLQNGVEWTSEGVVGGAVKLSGATMAISAPQDPIGTGSATITAWIKPSSIPYLGVIVSNNSNGFSFRVAESFKRLQCTNGSTVAYSGNNSISVNVWHFVTAVRTSDGTCTMYVNGVQSGAANQSVGSVVAGNSGLYIGRRPAAAYPFDGMIDDVRIYNRTLSAEEIMSIYTGGGGVPEPTTYTLRVNTNGSGSVSSVPTGISCGSACTKAFNEDTQITLTATPSSGATFDGWSGGGCSGTGTCTFSLVNDTDVTARFVSDNPPVISGTTVTAVDCSQTRVQQAIDLATDGMTVIVPAGTCAWKPAAKTGGAVTMNNKSIVLKGAGIGQTNIVLTDAPEYNQSALSVSMSVDKPFRVTGFTFSGDGKNAYITVYGISKSFRIDHISNKADTAGATRLLSITGHTYGVVDHVESHSRQTGGSGMILVRGEDATARMSGNTAWLRPLALGSPQAVFIEDSTFTGEATGFTGFATDIENGGALVFRKNRVTNLEFGSHGAQSSGGRGAMVWEVYDNTFVTDHTVYSVMAWLRGGTGVIFSNEFTRLNGAYGHYIAFDNPRAHTAYGTFGSKCDGTNSWDGNEDATGYPCLDQIGRSAGNPGQQVLAPAYEWNNKVSGTGADVDVTVINPPSEKHIKEGRDYYSDQSRPGYTPYIYPHPLVVSGFTSDAGGPVIELPPGVSVPVTPSPVTPPTTLRGDFNSDGRVNSLDFSALQSKWNQASTLHDLNTDGIVNTLDYSILVQNWTG